MHMSDPSPAQFQVWIERMNAGDLSARDELIAHACGRLRRLAHMIFADFARVRRWEETADVLQNALTRLLQALRTIKVTSPRQFFGLAALEIRRELIDLARHYFGPEGAGANCASAVREEGRTPPTPESPDLTHDPERLALWTTFHEQVEALPQQEREVFGLLWYQELSQPEVAALLGVSVPTVKRRWLSARLRLQTALPIQEFGADFLAR